MIPFGEFAPDMVGSGAIHPEVVAIARNVVPIASGYGPLRDLAEFTQPLGSTVLGAAAFASADGAIYNFAGTATGLFVRNSQSGAWKDATNPAGYLTPDGNRWEFVKYGSFVIATNGFNPIQSLDIDAGDTLFADLSPDAPRARHIAAVGEFLVAGNLIDEVDGAVHGRVQWPAIGDPSNWPDAGSDAARQVQSDLQDLRGDGGGVQRIVGGLTSADGLILQDRAIVRMIYTGDDRIFTLNRIEGGRGALAPGAVTSSGGLVYYLADDGFYECDGSSSRNIGAERVDRWVFSQLDTSRLAEITAEADPINKFIIWSFPTNSRSEIADRVVIYAWSINRWSYGETATECLHQMMVTGYTIEDLDVFGTIEAIPAPFDSRLWQGDQRAILAAFTENHKDAAFTGATLEAEVQTGDAIINPGKHTLVWRIVPIVDGGTVSARLGYRLKTNDSITWSPWADQTDASWCGVIGRGRVHRADVRIAAGGDWQTAQGIELDGVVAGDR